MLGQITKFHSDMGVGVIAAENGMEYRFAAGELVNEAKELVGQAVDFLIHQRQPKDILVLTGSPWHVFAGKRRRH